MDALILGLYAFFVWLIFFKFKWLPWNTTSMVIVITIPVVGLTIMILLLNVFAPSSADVRVIKPVVNVVPQVGGRVLEVPVEPNRLVKKGEILFRIDPTPYELAVQEPRGAAREHDRERPRARRAARRRGGGIAAARGAVQQADARVREIQAKLDFTRKRVEDNRELVRRGAGDRFTLESAETDMKSLIAQLDTARGVLAQAKGSEVQAVSSERQVQQKIAGKVGKEYAPAAQVRAQLENARWQLDQTTVRAPSDGYAINVQLRTGSFTAAFPITPAMTFVENTYQVIALYHQNELHQIEPGQRGRIHPPSHSRARVQGQGRLDHLGAGPGPVRQQHRAADDRLRPDRPRPVPGEADHRRARRRQVPARRRDRRGRRVHEPPRLPAHPAQGAAARGTKMELPDPEAALSMARRLAAALDLPAPGRRRVLALAAAALALPGCALKSPPPPGELAAAELAHATPPPAYKAGGLAEQVQAGWLQSFGDPRLPPLAEEALAYNADLRIAAARVEIAAAALKAAGGAVLPR
jgi:multidrug resistance efflux pump